MTTDIGTRGSTVLSPDEAFAVLGNKARLQILRALGEAEEPLAYSDLFDRIEYDDSSNFHYHLDKLAGHFIRRTDAGYELRQAARRVVEAILSGAITDDPILEPTAVDKPCTVCSARLEVAYRHERVKLHCGECDGLVGTSHIEGEHFRDFGNHGYIPLPPAGVQGRTATEVLHAAELWVITEMRTASRGVCPRCSATVDHSLSVCDSHDATDSRCGECGRRFEATVRLGCTNCLFAVEVGIPAYLGVHTELMGFLIEHGIDPVSPEGFDFPYAVADETVLSHRPFRARYVFAAEDESISLTVDETLSVTEVTRTPATDPES